MPSQSKPYVQEFKASADLQITRDMYEDALRDLQEEQVFCYLIFTFSSSCGYITIRLPLSPHICAPSNLIVSQTSHLCIIKFDCLSHLLLVPGDLEEQEQCPNLDPRRRRRLKTSPKPPDYLHLQYLTICFPVPLKRVFIYPPSKLVSQAVFFHAGCAPYSICRNCCK